jgi:dipeptidyl aminopeptidase/acylaminoacyl peptidase
LSFGPNTDRLPIYSPDGRRVAFLSDRLNVGNFRLYLLDPVSGAVRPTPPVNGWVEYLHWSPDGKRILLGVAGHGADVSGAQGAIASKQTAGTRPSWMPTVETGDERYRWRRIWVYELASDSVRAVSHADTNVWEAVWCGKEAIAAVGSVGPSEGLWYTARLYIVEVGTGTCREIYAARDQLGWPAASPSGNYLAIVEGLCSDRCIVAGEVRLIETFTGTSQRVDTGGVDITYADWRSEERLLLAGHRGFESVVGLYDVIAGEFSQVWASSAITTGGTYMTVAGLDDTGACVLVGEGFARAPEIAVICQGEYRTVKSFDLGHTDSTKPIDLIDRLSWKAPDGLEIHGWLLRPKGHTPCPLVMYVHGGPVWHWKPTWLGRGGVAALLIQAGYAVFFPNPRGSTGRGQAFVHHVLGDMGGADTYDLLSGLDYLVERRIADPKRVGVVGVSYGGFMTSWLVAQDRRFAAAVSVAPMINYVTQHLLSNIPHFVSIFLQDQYYNPSGRYFERSPVMHAHKVQTPTLNVCGALDRSAPPEEATQFHNALLLQGVESVLVTYPQEGHGVRKLPAAIDYSARIVSWFQAHMPTELNRAIADGD